MKMTKTFREKSKQKVLGGKSAGEQTGPSLFVLANKGENFQGQREEAKEDMNRYPVHTTHSQTHTPHSGGFVMFCAAGLTDSHLQDLFVIQSLLNRQLEEGTFL